MRPVWRLLRLFLVMIGYTLYTSVRLRLYPPDQRPFYRAVHQQRGVSKLCRILRVRISVAGSLPERRGMLIVCNHLGVLDPLVLAAQMPLAFAAKVELQRWPLLGRVCATMGVLFVDRERPSRTSAFVEQVRDKLRQNVPVLVFPEGTTGRGDTVRPFKTGAFEAVAGLEGGAVLPLFLRVVAVEGEPARSGRGDEVSWFDGRPFLAHCWQVLGLRSVDLELGVGVPVATAGRDRKELARLLHRDVSALGERAGAGPGDEERQGEDVFTLVL